MELHAGTWAGVLVCALSASAADLLDIGRHRQLFFDDRAIETSRGLERTMHPATKYEANPIMARETPWDGLGPRLHGTVLRDEDDGIFRMWYEVRLEGQPDHVVCYATSRDGLHWERPELDVVSDPRWPGPNNIVVPNSGLPDARQAIFPGVAFTPSDPDPGRRYKMIYWDRNLGAPTTFAGACAAFSADGVHWTQYEHNPVFDIASDVTAVCWDPLRERYLMHHKMWHVEGKVRRVHGVDFPVGDVSYWSDFYGPAQREGVWQIWDGRVVDYSTGEPRYGTAAVEFDEEPRFWRVVARAESKDFIHWGNIRIVFDLPQEGDPAGTSTYGMEGFPYEGMYVGLLQVLHDEQTIDLQLTYSHDGVEWNRCHDRTPFIGLGPAGSYDSGMVFASTLPVAMGDELWFYYGAMDRTHGVIGNEVVALATLRRDGFVSLDAARSGELVTRPVVCNGGVLVLNLQCATDGYAAVELLDEGGKPIPGFTRADCDRVTGDAVTKVVTWRGASGLGELSGRPVKVRIRLHKARLYAFGFEEEG